MIAWLREFLFGRKTPVPESVPELDEHEITHNATIARADRLLKPIEDYRRAEEARRRRHP